MMGWATWRGVLPLVLAAVVLDLVLIQPNHPAALSWKTLLLFPLELPAILLALVAFGAGQVGRVLRVALVAALTLIAALKTADFVMFTALNRGFNPVADLPLVSSLYDLIVGALGQPAAIATVIGSLLALIGLIAALWWATGVWARVPRPRIAGAVALVGAIAVTGIAIMDIGARMGRWEGTLSYPGTAFTARVGVERVLSARATLADLLAFRQAATEDPLADQRALFDLVDRDVLIIFVESYGRTSFDTPLYAPTHRATLAQAERDLQARGLTLASGFLTSPTQGGQSWLAHASFANGLWVDNQTSYGAVLQSGRQTLFHLAARSGFHTAAVMPQIIMEWPEAQSMGFDTILAAADLGYKGRPFNWVEMPDQFTFAAMDRLLRNGTRDKPLFIQLATGSSHAPWVPVPQLLPWQDLGDGTVFDPVVAAGDPPSVVWKDKDRVREQYRLALDYALQTVFAYAALHADTPPLLIVLGDHQAAGFVAQDDRAEVPIHLIGPADLVGVIADEGFYPGLLPPDTAVARPMDQMRGHLVRALSSTRQAEATE